MAPKQKRTAPIVEPPPPILPSDHDSGSGSDSDSPPPIVAVKPKKPMSRSKKDLKQPIVNDHNGATDAKKKMKKRDVEVEVSNSKKKKRDLEVEVSNSKKQTKHVEVEVSKKQKKDVEVEVSNSKKQKKDVEVEVSNSKKREKPVLFERRFELEDELVLLSGILDFDADPKAEIDAFYPYIKEKLSHVDFTPAQLLDKIRRLKKKYLNNARPNKRGQERTISNPGENKSYQISKQLWGGDVVDDAENTQIEEEPQSPVNFNLNLNLDASFFNYGLPLLDNATKSDLEEKWMQLGIEEAELFVRQTELVRELTKLVLDAHKKKK